MEDVERGREGETEMRRDEKGEQIITP